MSDEILTTKHDLTEAVQSAAAGLHAELAAKDKRITELLDKLGDAISHSALPDIIADRDSLRAQLEVAKQNGIAVAEMWANNYSMLEAQLETARQEIERLKGDLLWARRNTALAESDRDKALRVAEEALVLARDVIDGCTPRRESDTGHLGVCSAQCGPANECHICGEVVRKIEAYESRHTALKAGRVCPKCKGAKVLRVLGSGGDYEDWPCECTAAAQKKEG